MFLSQLKCVDLTLKGLFLFKAVTSSFFGSSPYQTGRYDRISQRSIHLRHSSTLAAESKGIPDFLLSCNTFQLFLPRPDEIYNPSGECRVCPRVSSQSDRPGRRSVDILVRWPVFSQYEGAAARLWHEVTTLIGFALLDQLLFYQISPVNKTEQKHLSCRLFSITLEL